MRRDVRPPHRPAAMIPFGEAPGGDEGPRQPATELAQRATPPHRAPPTARPRAATCGPRSPPEGRAGGRERPRPRRGSRPRRAARRSRPSPRADQPQLARANPHEATSRRRVHDERLETAQLRVDKHGDVPIPAVLAQDGQRVPEPQVRCVRPGQAGMRGRQRAPLGPAGLGGAADQARSLGSIVGPHFKVHLVQAALACPAQAFIQQPTANVLPAVLAGDHRAQRAHAMSHPDAEAAYNDVFPDGDQHAACTLFDR
jgi:hypothetical protein